MPYAENFQQQQQDEERKRAGMNAAASSNGTGVSLGGPIAAPSAGPTAPGQQGQGSGKFVNFDRIFAANKGDAQNMAGGVAQDVGAKAQGAQQATNNAYANFNQQVQTGTNVYGATGGLSRDEKAQRAAQGYSGPTDVAGDAGYRDAQKQVDTANQYLGLLDPKKQGGSAPGLQTYMQEKYRNAGSGGGYTNGMSVWDAALTGAAGGPQFDQLRQKYAGLDAALSSAQQKAAGDVANAQFTTDDAQKQFGADVAGYDASAAARKAADDAANATKEQGGAKIRQNMGEDAYQRWVAAGSPTPVDDWIKKDQGQHVKVSG